MLVFKKRTTSTSVIIIVDCFPITACPKMFICLHDVSIYYVVNVLVNVSVIVI